MHLTTIDFLVIAGYFVLAIGTASVFIKRARRSMLDYFVSHRSMPWWLAGTAMVATTFSADTPLAVFEMGGAIILAIVSWRAVGGSDVLYARLGDAHPAGAAAGTIFGHSRDVLAFWPAGSGAWVVPAITVAALLGVSWWASWYPGAEP